MTCDDHWDLMVLDKMPCLLLAHGVTWWLAVVTWCDLGMAVHSLATPTNMTTPTSYDTIARKRHDDVTMRLMPGLPGSLQSLPREHCAPVGL